MAIAPDDPAREYARCLLRLHELDPRGEHDIPEADVICDVMDVAWRRMNGRQHRRMQGLSEDLYALADGGGIPVLMNPSEREEWSRTAGDFISRFQAGAD